MPLFNEESDRFETSVYRCSHLPDVEIWRVGRIHVEDPPSGRIIKARSAGPFQLVISQGLSLEVNGAPFSIHVDIGG